MKNLTSGNLRGRLFGYDRRIAINVLRATFAKWRDRAIAAIMLVACWVWARTSSANWSWTMAAWAGLGIGIVVGLAAGRVIAARLAFHAADGPLAADALGPSTRRYYLVAWSSTGAAMLTAAMLVARPSLLLTGLPGYLIGAVIGYASACFIMPTAAAGTTKFGRTVRAWLQRPRAGPIAAAVLLGTLAPTARFLEADALVPIAGIEAVILVLALTIVGDGVVRFMTLAGHGAGRIVARHARGALLFAGVAAPLSALGLGPVVGGVIAAVAGALLLLMALRILAYRLHGRRIADVAVAILSALLVQVAVFVPIALPFLVVAVFWHLHRRAVARTWLLA